MKAFIWHFPFCLVAICVLTREKELIATLLSRVKILQNNDLILILCLFLAEIIGCTADCCYGTTKIISNNAFNPSWDEKFQMGLIHVPSLAVLRISVYNAIKNPVPQSELLCQAVLPADYLRRGYRWSLKKFLKLFREGAVVSVFAFWLKFWNCGQK